MDLSVKKSRITGMMEIPSSKSHTIRAIYLAAAASGTSTIKMPLVSNDTVACLRAASILGAWVKRGDDSVWRISGTGGHFLQPAKTIDMENSGTGLRLFTSLAALSSLPVRFDGDSSLRTRKMGSLLSALESLGAKTASESGNCPLTVCGPIRGGETEVDGKTSQYLSSLLMVAPLLKEDTVIHVEDLHEIPYVYMTLEWLKKLNVQLEHDEALTRFHIPGNQKYTPFTTQIPVDFSTAAFPLLAVAITGGTISIPNLDFEDIQGDKAVFAFFEQMGVTVTPGKNITVLECSGKLKGIEADLNATPDALPVMAVAAACAEGKSRLYNVPQARLKECDRIHAMAVELRKMGAKIEEFSDGMEITGGKLKACKDLCSYNDHRIAMALAIAGMAAAGESLIHDAECVSVTFPDFVECFTGAGARFQIQEY